MPLSFKNSSTNLSANSSSDSPSNKSTSSYPYKNTTYPPQPPLPTLKTKLNSSSTDSTLSQYESTSSLTQSSNDTEMLNFSSQEYPQLNDNETQCGNYSSLSLTCCYPDETEINKKKLAERDQNSFAEGIKLKKGVEKKKMSKGLNHSNLTRLEHCTNLTYTDGKSLNPINSASSPLSTNPASPHITDTSDKIGSPFSENYHGYMALTQSHIHARKYVYELHKHRITSLSSSVKTASSFSSSLSSNPHKLLSNPPPKTLNNYSSNNSSFYKQTLPRLMKPTKNRLNDMKEWQDRIENKKYEDDIWWEKRKPLKTAKEMPNVTSRLFQPTKAYLCGKREKFNYLKKNDMINFDSSPDSPNSTSSYSYISDRDKKNGYYYMSYSLPQPYFCVSSSLLKSTKASEGWVIENFIRNSNKKEEVMPVFRTATSYAPHIKSKLYEHTISSSIKACRNLTQLIEEEQEEEKRRKEEDFFNRKKSSMVQLKQFIAEIQKEKDDNNINFSPFSHYQFDFSSGQISDSSLKTSLHCSPDSLPPSIAIPLALHANSFTIDKPIGMKLSTQKQQEAEEKAKRDFVFTEHTYNRKNNLLNKGKKMNENYSFCTEEDRVTKIDHRKKRDNNRDSRIEKENINDASLYEEVNIDRINEEYLLSSASSFTSPPPSSHTNTSDLPSSSITSSSTQQLPNYVSDNENYSSNSSLYSTMNNYNQTTLTDGEFIPSPNHNISSQIEKKEENENDKTFISSGDCFETEELSLQYKIEKNNSSCPTPPPRPTFNSSISSNSPAGSTLFIIPPSGLNEKNHPPSTSSKFSPNFNYNKLYSEKLKRINFS